MRPKFDLQTNLPVQGTLKYLDHTTGQYGDDLRAALVVPTGQDPYAAGEYVLYLPFDAIGGLLRAAVVREFPPKDEKRQFKVQLTKALIRVLKRETKGDDGKAKKVIDVALVNADGSLTQLRGETAMTTPASGEASDAPAKANENGHSPAPPAPRDRKEIFQTWLAIGEEYGAALALSRHYQGDQASDEAVQAGAATLLIRAEKCHLLGEGFPSLAKTMREYLERPQSARPTVAAA